MGLGRLSDWMIADGLGVDGLTPERVREFSALCKRGEQRPAGRRALEPLLSHLRALGVVPAETVGATPTDQLIGRYRAWMIDDRALAARTVGRYEATAQRFLQARAERTGGCGAEALTGAEVTGFLLGECERVSVGSAKGRVAELRSLLRFLIIEGWTNIALATSVPPVAGWRDTALPPTLARSEVEAIVSACDQATVTGAAGLGDRDDPGPPGPAGRGGRWS